MLYYLRVISTTSAHYVVNGHVPTGTAYYCIYIYIKKCWKYSILILNIENNGKIAHEIQTMMCMYQHICNNVSITLMCYIIERIYNVESYILSCGHITTVWATR